MNFVVVILADARVTFDWLLRTSLHVALLAIVVMLVTMLVGRRLSPGCRHALWLLVAVRMALPVLPSSPWSVFNMFDAERTIVAGSSADAIVGEPETGWIITKDPLPGQPPQIINDVVEADRLDWNWRHALLLAWVIGVVAFLGRVVVANVIFARRIRRGTGVDDAGVLALLCACQRDMNVTTTPVRLIATDAVRGPALWGTFRPAMLIPADMLRELSQEDLRFVFLHELAHLKRRDIAGDWILSLLHAFHWFNPAAWLALSRLRAERELSRDAMVLAVTNPREERGYGRTILKLVQTISRPGVLRPGAVGILEEKTELKRRIAMIARFDRNGSRGRGLAVALALLIACVLLTDRRVADAAPTEGDPAHKLAENPPAPPQPAGKPQLPPDWPDAKEASEAQAAKDADAKAEKQLARELPEVRFDNVSFSDAIDFLRDVSGANIFVNWVVLERAGIQRNAPVTTRLKEVKLSRAMEQILQNVGGGRIELGFVVKEGVITISTTEDLDRDTEVRVYDVRDLLVVEEKDEKAAQKKRAELVESITDMVQETVHPDSWVNRGGKVGSIRFLSGQLIVTHTPRHHAQIEQLLNQIRETRALHISIEVRLITTTPEIVKRLDLEQPEGDAAAVLGDAELQALLRAVQADANATILTAPRMTLINGQNGQLRIGNEQAYVKDIERVKDDFRPQVGTNFEGLSLDVAATSAADRKRVTLNGHLRVSKLTGMEGARWPHAPAGRDDLVVQVPRMTVREWKSVVSVPDGRTIATVLDVPPEAREKGAGPARLVVLIRPRIVVQREVEQQAFPLLRGGGDEKK